MNHEFLDFRLGIQGRKAKHPDPPDDHRLTDANTNNPPKICQEFLPDKETTDESIDINHPGLWVMKFTQSAYRDMLDHLLSREPEAAGILLGPVGAARFRVTVC